MRVALRVGLAVCLMGALAAQGRACGQEASTSAAQEKIPAAYLVQPAVLVGMLQGADKPVVLQVGSHVLFAEAHIAGAEYAGPAAKPEGLAALRERVAGLPKDRGIVIYCGCCPWVKCPNIRPAFEELQRLGFTHVRALYLATDFGTDWVKQGYPTEAGR